MPRACSPGGRFTTDFETQAIASAIGMDLQRPVGTTAEWWTYNTVLTQVDPIYDVGNNVPDYTGGKVWNGPYLLPVVRAVIKQGQTKTSQQGFYNADLLHLTVNATDMEKIIPKVMLNPDDIDRDRVVWKNEVWRPFQAQQTGVVAEGFVLLSIDLIQVMPEELVNDQQFLDKATVLPDDPPAHLVYDVDGGLPNTIEFNTLLDANLDC